MLKDTELPDVATIPRNVLENLLTDTVHKAGAAAAKRLATAIIDLCNSVVYELEHLGDDPESRG